MAVSTAARELHLKRGEFIIAVHLGLVRVSAQRGEGSPRVPREEIERLRARDGFPDVLRERARAVGTAEGARLIGVSAGRFTKLARAGCFTPITFYLNRYRAVVWLYLAEELAGFAAREPLLLTGRSPVWVRDRLEGGADRRAHNWRVRRVERLMALTDDPWARAAVLAGTLDPLRVAELIDEPSERAHLTGIRPEPVLAPTVPPHAQDTMARLMRAEEPEEALRRQADLIAEVDRARRVRPVPRTVTDRRGHGPGHRLADADEQGPGRRAATTDQSVQAIRPAPETETESDTNTNTEAGPARAPAFPLTPAPLAVSATDSLGTSKRKRKRKRERKRERRNVPERVSGTMARATSVRAVLARLRLRGLTSRHPHR
ncbi:DUF6397 family protein [Streptomyces sp. NPDC014744]|uniref:DUF6397 family protein n=1 Tax=Streptomyces sp. NPDC014744 TaxID=3364903 RepID=UPI0036F694FD